MSRKTIDIDDEMLERTACELGTSSDVETINASLAFVAARRRLAASLADPLVWGAPDLADPGVRASARR